MKVTRNEIVANDVTLVQKLTKEISQLREILSMRKKRGNITDVETEFLKLKAENERLKNFVMNNENIEKLLNENKLLKLELQKLRTGEYDKEVYSSAKESSSSSYGIKIDKSLFKMAGENIMSNSKISKNVINISAANERLKFLERMEKETENMAKKQHEKIKLEKKMKEEIKINRSLEVIIIKFRELIR